MSEWPSGSRRKRKPLRGESRREEHRLIMRNLTLKRQAVRRLPILETTVLAVVSGLLGCAGIMASSEEPPRNADISFTIASGGFGAPPESIAMVRRDGTITLSINRGSIGDGKAVTETASLDIQEFDRIWKIVTQNRLDQFKPLEQSGVALDYGTRTLKISTDNGGDKKPTQHEVEWEKPLNNQSEVRPLIQELGKLVRLHMKQVQPIFFP